MPAEAHNNHQDTPRKSNGTTRAGRCTDASPARQARTISPEQSLKHRCQTVPGRLNRPALLVQCPRLCWLGCAVLDPAGRTVTRNQLLFAPDTWSPLSWRQRSSHCVQDAPWLVSSAILWFSSTFAVIAREAGSAGPFIGGCRGLTRSRDPDVSLRWKRDRIPSSAASCNSMQKSRRTPSEAAVSAHAPE